MRKLPDQAPELDDANEWQTPQDQNGLAVQSSYCYDNDNVYEMVVDRTVDGDTDYYSSPILESNDLDWYSSQGSPPNKRWKRIASHPTYPT